MSIEIENLTLEREKEKTPDERKKQFLKIRIQTMLYRIFLCKIPESAITTIMPKVEPHLTNSIIKVLELIYEIAYIENYNIRWNMLKQYDIAYKQFDQIFEKWRALLRLEDNEKHEYYRLHSGSIEYSLRSLIKPFFSNTIDTTTEDYQLLFAYEVL